MNNYEKRLLADWESIFRQGMLTFWVFVALRGKALSIADIKKRVAELTNTTYDAAEQTLYRLLRKQYELELVDYKEAPGNSGPNKKLYFLSAMGERLLADFTARNIRLFQQAAVQSIMKKGKK